MIIYRNHYVGRKRKSKGYTFHPTETSAKMAEAPKGTIEVEGLKIDVQLTKQGVLDLLRRYASHPNNR